MLREMFAAQDVRIKMKDYLVRTMMKSVQQVSLLKENSFESSTHSSYMTVQYSNSMYRGVGKNVIGRVTM